MLKKTLFGLVVLLYAGAVFAQAYRWVDENGVVHFSDRPHPGAERIELPTSKASSRSAAPVTALQQPTQSDETEAADAEPEEPFRYESLVIASPGPEETLWNIEGVLNVTLQVQPGLQPGHQVRVYFDGQPQTVTGTSFQLQEVWRGAHNVQAEIIDETGNLMIRSLPNRFYVQQNSIARLN